MKRRQFLIASSVLVAGGLLGTACGGSSSSTTTAASPTTESPTTAVDDSVTVFAASSVTAAFTEIAKEFEAAHPGSKVTLNFAASSELVTQINNGAPADVFASADSKNMAKLADGTVDPPQNFASNRLEIIVQAGNPKGITGLADLAKSGVAYVTAAPEVPIGKYAQQALDAAGVKVSPRSLEANVKGIVSKVTLGEADAGIVYVTDVLAAGSKATGVAIPDASNVIAHYPIAVPATSEHRAAGAAFAAFVLSSAGQQILAKYGFVAP
jgi:molybdate transport system substrate-binding protein